MTGTAAEALTAIQVAYLSATGWLKADADLAASGLLPTLGFVVADVANAASGTFRINGRMTGFSGLTAGTDYYVSGTAGAITSTAPAMARYVGRADSISSLIITPNPRAVVMPVVPNGRLTLTTAVAVTTADVTAATTIYYTPYLGASLTLYDGSQWFQRTFAQVSIAVPATTSQMYDVFVYDNAGVVTLELTAWTNDTTRATALTTQDGVLVKTGVLTRRYLGSFRTTGVSGQTEDSEAYRGLWNYYHRLPRTLSKRESTATWAYTVLTWRQARGQTANKVEYVIGVAEAPLDLAVSVMVGNLTVNVGVAVGIGHDSITAPVTGQIGGELYSTGNALDTVRGSVRLYPSVGYHYGAWLEESQATGTTNWTSTNFLTAAAGLSGTIYG